MKEASAQTKRRQKGGVFALIFLRTLNHHGPENEGVIVVPGNQLAAFQQLKFSSWHLLIWPSF